MKRSDPEKHKAQVRAANRARYRAVNLLIEAHPAEYAAFYAQEAAAEGVTPKPRERLDTEKITSQIEELQARLARSRT
jgi:hypothetical protein